MPTLSDAKRTALIKNLRPGSGLVNSRRESRGGWTADLSRTHPIYLFTPHDSRMIFAGSCNQSFEVPRCARRLRMRPVWLHRFGSCF